MAHGWWNLNPGETQTVIYSENRYLYSMPMLETARWGDPTGLRCS